MLRGGTFNLKFGRDVERVVEECRKLFGEYGLAFLCTQETDDYVDALREEFVVVGAGESCVLVARRGVKVDQIRRHEYGDGWTTVRGGRFPPAVHWTVRLDEWLRVRSVHLPTPSEWVAGHPVAPPDRLDDLIGTALGLRRYLRGPNARLAAGDWNEPPETSGRYSPQWIAAESRSLIWAPKRSTGHGRIDYVMARGALVTDLHVDDVVTEHSDHEPVIFTVRRAADE